MTIPQDGVATLDQSIAEAGENRKARSGRSLSFKTLDTLGLLELAASARSTVTAPGGAPAVSKAHGRRAWGQQMSTGFGKPKEPKPSEVLRTAQPCSSWAWRSNGSTRMGLDSDAFQVSFP